MQDLKVSGSRKKLVTLISISLNSNCNSLASRSQQLDIVFYGLDFVDDHPPRDAPIDSGRLIVGKVDFECQLHQREDASHIILFGWGWLFLRNRDHMVQPWVTPNHCQILRNLLGREDKGYAPDAAALLGIPVYFAVPSSWAKVMPPSA